MQTALADTDYSPGGKIKPLKAPKKQNKDLDDEDKAFLEKKRAGMHPRTLANLSVLTNSHR